MVVKMKTFHLFFSDSLTPFVRSFENCISELRIFKHDLRNSVAVSRNSKGNQSRINVDCLGLQIQIIQLHRHLKSYACKIPKYYRYRASTNLKITKAHTNIKFSIQSYSCHLPARVLWESEILHALKIFMNPL